MRVLLLLFAFALFFVGCATKKDILYNQLTLDDYVNAPYEHNKIQVGDILYIRVSGINTESVEIFQSSQNFVNNAQPEALKIQGYLVDEKGAIDLPLLGDLKVLDQTTSELEDVLTKKLESFIKNPVVSVRLVNFKVTVLGEVSAPGTYTILEERVTLPMVLGTAGDLTINGDRRNVQLIRTMGDSLVRQTLDLTRGDLLNSSNYYLRQNDLIYVAPNTAKVKSSGLVGNVGTLTSVISLLLTIILLAR